MTSPKRNADRKLTLLKSAVLGLIAATFVVCSRIELLEIPNAETDRDEVSTVWHPQLYRLVTFGHTPAAVDLQLIRFMTDGRIDKLAPGKHPKIFYYLDLATDLDPKFYNLYTAGANFLSVVRNDGLDALHIISKGERFRKETLPSLTEDFQKIYWPEPWRIPFIKAYVHLFELLDPDAAAETYAELAKIPEAPTAVKTMGTRLKEPDGIFAVGEQALETMYKTAFDDQVRDEVRKKQASLQLFRFLHQRNVAFEKWWSESAARKKLAEQKTWNVLFTQYVQESGITPRDPLGGRLFIDADGKIQSTSPRVAVLGFK